MQPVDCCFRWVLADQSRQSRWPSASPGWPSPSLRYGSQNMAYFVLLSGEDEVCCSSLTKTTPTCAPPRWTRLVLTRCFFAFAFACEMDGSFGMQEGAWFG